MKTVTKTVTGAALKKIEKALDKQLDILFKAIKEKLEAFEAITAEEWENDFFNDLQLNDKATELLYIRFGSSCTINTGVVEEEELF
jgi:hypothetical protein